MNGGDLKSGIMRPMEEETDGPRARSVLWYLTFFGFAINYIIRINASIAIVDMIDVNYKSASNKTIVTSECIVERNLTTSPELSNETNLDARYVSLERRFLDFLGVSQLKWACQLIIIVIHEGRVRARRIPMECASAVVGAWIVFLAAFSDAVARWCPGSQVRHEVRLRFLELHRLRYVSGDAAQLLL